MFNWNETKLEEPPSATWLSKQELHNMHAANKHLASTYRDSAKDYAKSVNYLMNSSKIS